MLLGLALAYESVGLTLLETFLCHIMTVSGCDREFNHVYRYRKVPKFSDARKLCCNLPKIQTNRPNFRVFCQKNANGIADNEDPDHTAPLGAV